MHRLRPRPGCIYRSRLKSSRRSCRCRRLVLRQRVQLHRRLAVEVVEEGHDDRLEVPLPGETGLTLRPGGELQFGVFGVLGSVPGQSLVDDVVGAPQPDHGLLGGV